MFRIRIFRFIRKKEEYYEKLFILFFVGGNLFAVTRTPYKKNNESDKDYGVHAV